ncbi:hypothetical protein OCAE111667_25710 [Occultella aeris]|uniref:Uncharacterized protein n=1 Tax=Occultella aeris TaxID=2761496 RepID=A0A7M4DFN7_9MICO|nr:hypothetical protein HALOF300_00928 [Occultella aeris]
MGSRPGPRRPAGPAARSPAMAPRPVTWPEWARRSARPEPKTRRRRPARPPSAAVHRARGAGAPPPTPIARAARAPSGRSAAGACPRHRSPRGSTAAVARRRSARTWHSLRYTRPGRRRPARAPRVRLRAPPGHWRRHRGARAPALDRPGRAYRERRRGGTPAVRARPRRRGSARPRRRGRPAGRAARAVAAAATGVPGLRRVASARRWSQDHGDRRRRAPTVRTRPRGGSSAP